MPTQGEIQAYAIGRRLEGRTGKRLKELIRQFAPRASEDAREQAFLWSISQLRYQRRRRAREEYLERFHRESLERQAAAAPVPPGVAPEEVIFPHYPHPPLPFTTARDVEVEYLDPQSGLPRRVYLRGVRITGAPRPRGLATQLAAALAAAYDQPGYDAFNALFLAILAGTFRIV